MTATRQSVENTIQQASASLRECLSLLRDHVRLKDWPVAERDAFLAACFNSFPANNIEMRKADALRWHLFQADVPAPVPLPPNSITAERIRADLIGLVKLGAGRHLVDELTG